MRMEMSKEEFMMLHERLLDRLDRLEHKIESLTTIGGKQMLDNREMRLLLKVWRPHTATLASQPQPEGISNQRQGLLYGF